MGATHAEQLVEAGAQSPRPEAGWSLAEERKKELEEKERQLREKDAEIERLRAALAAANG